MSEQITRDAKEIRHTFEPSVSLVESLAGKREGWVEEESERRGRRRARGRLRIERKKDEEVEHRSMMIEEELRGEVG